MGNRLLPSLTVGALIFALAYATGFVFFWWMFGVCALCLALAVAKGKPRGEGFARPLARDGRRWPRDY